MTETHSIETLIIGGGVIGCSVAYHLSLEGGRGIALLERESLASGATGICPGGIRQQFSSPPDCLLAQRSMRFWERINQALRTQRRFELERSGYLFLADSSSLLEQYQEQVDMQNRLGIESRILAPEEIGDLLPALRLEGIRGASYCPEDSFLEDCHGVTDALARRALERGVRIAYQTAASLSPSAQGWRVVTDQAQWEARNVVLAAGAESVPLASGAGLELPIRPLRRRLAFTTRVGRALLPPLLVAPERGVAAKQMKDGVFYLGWLGESPEDDDTLFLERALSGAASLLPDFEEIPVRRIIGGEYDVTPDHRPILGPAPGIDGLYIAAGFSGHGFMIAPAVGESIASLILGRPSPALLESFAVERFTQPTPSERMVI